MQATENQAAPMAATPESVTDSTVTPARVLHDAATYLTRHGWVQGAYYDATSGSFTPPACLVGAIGMVCYGGPVDAPAQHFADPGFLDFEEAVLHLDRYLLAEDGSESYEFNDAKGRQLDDVTRVLRDAASRPAHELIDAIRVIDAKNAQIAAIGELLKPRGIFGETAEPAPPVHADYPHTPGTRYDCPGCEARCFCTDGFECVHCAIEVEQIKAVLDDAEDMFGGLNTAISDSLGDPYCQGSFNGTMSCADAVTDDNVVGRLNCWCDCTEDTAPACDGYRDRARCSHCAARHLTGADTTTTGGGA